MVRTLSALVLAGALGLGGLPGLGATEASAQGFGLGISIGSPYGYGGYGRGYGGSPYGYGGSPYGYGGSPYGYGGSPYGYGGYRYSVPGSYYYSRTTTTTVVYCNRCGGYHSPHAPCGGGYRPYGGGLPLGGPFPW